MAACQRILLEVVVFVLVCSFSAASDQRGFERAALLRFKSSVSDPSGLLQSWSSAVGDHCSWSFVSCDARSRVISLNISGFCSKLGPFDAICTDPSRRLSGRDPSRRLSGSLTPAIGGLSQLRFLSLPFHGFYGEIPTEIWRLERLEVIDLSENLLNGTLPRQFSPNLRVINLSGNSMEGEIPVSISSCTSLEALDLSRNRFNGSIPRFLANFSELKEIKLGYNHFQKSIPEEIGINCMNLEYLDLSGNQLCGNIPPNLGNCIEFRVLLLFSNSLDGSIPSELGKLKNLQVLDLSRNNLSGFIPAQLGNCLNLSVLVISNPFDPLIQNKGSDGEFNAFEGGIPENITTLPKLRVLWAPRARIEGEIPNNWGKCENLEMVNLGENMLTGDLQSYFERCNNLKFLNLSSNRLTGRVYGNLPLSSTSDFDTSENQPRFDDLANGYYSFFAYKSREKLNSNKLSKTTPENLRRFLSSPSDTTDSLSQVTPPSSSNGGGFSSIEIASITSASAIVSVLLALVLLYIYTRKCNPRPSSSEPSRRSSRTRQEVTRFVDLGVPITYESVVRSTGNFNASNCIGSGGFGATYKAEISPGILVAIKRLSVGRVQGIEQFQAEIKTLGRCKHPNLVTLIGYHLGDSEMFLIYNYLPGGNLEKFIQERSKKPVDWRMLHKIALDIAQALTFLHDNCIPRILHRDVKPSNILLDNEYNAYLSDFGLARLLGNSETHATTGVAGTFGYVAPEYAMTCRVSDKADVYSYGVVLLELISDKKALDPSFSPYGNGFNIVGWASMLLNKGRAKEFFFEGLWENAPHDDLVEVLHLGIKCTGDNLSTRPSMKHVVRRLKELRPPNF